MGEGKSRYPFFLKENTEKLIEILLRFKRVILSILITQPLIISLTFTHFHFLSLICFWPFKSKLQENKEGKGNDTDRL